MQTSDNQNEVFEVVDVNDQVVGQATRREVHKNKNLIHRSVAVAIFNNNNKLFLQRRSQSKDTDALLWTISCTGHVQKSESYEATARRELKEELGIENVSLNFLAKYLYQGINETEMTMLYKVNYDGEIILQKEEIWEGKFFSIDQLAIAVETKEIELNLFARVALQKLDWIDI